MTSVGIVGGGIAGLTAADELSRRGYEVHVFEEHPTLLGGKARSHGHRPSGWSPVPAEHGFRFFPGFYRNVIETMRGIPRADGGSVADRLANAREIRYSFAGRYAADNTQPMEWEGILPALAERLTELLRPGEVRPSPLFEVGDLAYLAELFAWLRWASEDELIELESWSFTEFTMHVFPGRSTLAVKPSDRLSVFLSQAGTRMLVAAQPAKMSARTGLVTLARLLDPEVVVREEVDRLLQGPTNDEWIDPWAAALASGAERAPVTFHLGHSVTGLDFDGTRVRSFTTSPGAATNTFDHVVLALPHAAVAALLAPHRSSLPAQLGGLDRLSSDWMCGVQYYLAARPEICAGHVMYVDSPWALTSVCQAQFWSDFDWAQAGDGSVRDILSVCVSDWDTPGELVPKPAKQCTADEIRDEVWHQMCTSLNDADRHDLPRDQRGIVRAFALDPAVVLAADGTVSHNLMPLYINTVGSWHDRPRADVGLPNLFLAGDWVRTHADLATMESANEAGRHAVNAILERDAGRGDVPILTVDDRGLL